MRQLVRLRMRPSRDGKSFVYFIDYKDETGKRKRVSLGHHDRQKAKRQQAQMERELRMGVVEPQALRLSDFVTDSLARTGDQIRESTREEYLRQQLVGQRSQRIRGHGARGPLELQHDAQVLPACPRRHDRPCASCEYQGHEPRFGTHLARAPFRE